MMMMMTADDKFSWSQLGQLGGVGLVSLVDGCWLLMMVRVLSSHGQNARGMGLCFNQRWPFKSLQAGGCWIELCDVLLQNSCHILIAGLSRPGSLLWCQQPSLWMNIFNQRVRGPKFGQAHVLLRFYCPIRIWMKYKTKRYTKCKCQLQDNFRRLKMCCTGLYCDFDSENLPAG